MGGVDDNEPPRVKRVKVSEGKVELVGSRGAIKRVEFVRIITEALCSLGYERSSAVLEEESGIHLHTPVVNLFRKHILDGIWDESVVTLHKTGYLDENAFKSALLLILEQKFLEFLEKDQILDALETVKSEIVPLGINEERVGELCTCIVFPSWRPSLGFANHGIEMSNSRLKLLEELEKLLPPGVMIPERRLEHLVEEALDVQSRACYYHNSMDSLQSLYREHLCGKDQMPSQTMQVLQAHHNEVWFLEFSNNGKYLASSSKDKSAIIWEVHDSGEVLMKHKLAGHEMSVQLVAWSPDDCQILTCGREGTIRLWDANSGECLHVYTKSGLVLNSCCWFPDGRHFFSVVTDMGICLWDMDGNELECWKGYMMLQASDVAVTKDGKWIISICQKDAISLRDREAKLEKLIQEVDFITSFSLSNDSKFLLVNLLKQKIHLWSIVGDPQLVAEYKGHKREFRVIKSCFGGLDQAFIASGSEDSQVYIWHRHTGKLVQTLPGHSSCVSCVAWNPAKPHMLASGSDDHTIRIWGLNRVNEAQGGLQQ